MLLFGDAMYKDRVPLLGNSLPWNHVNTAIILLFMLNPTAPAWDFASYILSTSCLLWLFSDVWLKNHFAEWLAWFGMQAAAPDALDTQMSEKVPVCGIVLEKMGEVTASWFMTQGWQQTRERTKHNINNSTLHKMINQTTPTTTPKITVS